MLNNDILKIENLKHPEGTFILRWNVTKLCNYYCDFCIQGNREKHISDSKGESVELRMNICDKIIEFIENELNGIYEIVTLYLLGGEVTILKDFYDILKKLVECKFDGVLKIHITTNLSSSLGDLSKIKELFKFNNRILSISCDYYKQFTKEKEFVSKVKFLSKKDFYTSFVNSFRKSNSKIGKFIFDRLKKYRKNSNIIVSIGYPLTCDDDVKMFFRFKRRHFMLCDSISPIIIREYKTSITDKYSDKLINDNEKVLRVTLKNGDIKYFNNTSKISLAITDEKYFNPKGFLCDAGMYNISINNLGVISRCQTCYSKTIIGNILDDDIKLLKQAMSCPIVTCNCTHYSVIKNEN